MDLKDYTDYEFKNQPRLIRYFLKASIWKNDATAKYYTGNFIIDGVNSF